MKVHSTIHNDKITAIHINVTNHKEVIDTNKVYITK